MDWTGLPQSLGDFVDWTGLPQSLGDCVLCVAVKLCGLDRIATEFG